MKRLAKVEKIADYISFSGNFKECWIDIDGTLLNTHIAAYAYKDYLGLETYQDCIRICAGIPDVDNKKLHTFFMDYCWNFPEPTIIYLMRLVAIPIVIKTNRKIHHIPNDIMTKLYTLTGKKIKGIVCNPNMKVVTRDVCLVDDFPMYEPRDVDVCVVREWSHKQNEVNNLYPLVK